jgi:hypothetical protein
MARDFRMPEVNWHSSPPGSRQSAVIAARSAFAAAPREPRLIGRIIGYPSVHSH